MTESNRLSALCRLMGLLAFETRPDARELFLPAPVLHVRLTYSYQAMDPKLTLSPEAEARVERIITRHPVWIAVHEAKQMVERYQDLPEFEPVVRAYHSSPDVRRVMDEITAAILEDARDPASPLHEYFEWDIDKAAGAWYSMMAKRN